MPITITSSTISILPKIFKIFFMIRLLVLSLRKALAARDIAALQEELRAACAALPRGATLRTLKVAAALALATLAEVAADGSRVWEHRIELTPLRQLWLAWQTRILGGP